MRKYYKKDKRDRKDWNNQKGREGCQRSKINPVIAVNNGFKANVYHHIIDRYQQRLIVLRWGTGPSIEL